MGGHGGDDINGRAAVNVGSVSLVARLCRASATSSTSKRKTRRYSVYSDRVFLSRVHDGAPAADGGRQAHPSMAPHVLQG